MQRRIDGLLDEAEEAVASMNWERAREASLSVLAADPDNADANTFLAMAAPHLDSEPGNLNAVSPEGDASPTDTEIRGETLRGRRSRCDATHSL